MLEDLASFRLAFQEARPGLMDRVREQQHDETANTIRARLAQGEEIAD